MAADVSSIRAPQPRTADPNQSQASFEERWAAWHSKGAAHDRAVRRRMIVAVPLVMVIVGLLSYVLLRA
jgi:hypothetical protein